MKNINLPIYVNKTLKAHNFKNDIYGFINLDHVLSYMKFHNIDQRQEFWFTISGDNIIYCCFFEYTYEG